MPRHQGSSTRYTRCSTRCVHCCRRAWMNSGAHSSSSSRPTSRAIQGSPDTRGPRRSATPRGTAVIAVEIEIKLPGSCPWWVPADGHNRSYRQPKDRVATDRFTRYCGHRPSSVRGVEIPKAAARCLSMPKTRRPSAAHDVEWALPTQRSRVAAFWANDRSTLEPDLRQGRRANQSWRMRSFARRPRRDKFAAEGLRLAVARTGAADPQHVSHGPSQLAIWQSTDSGQSRLETGPVRVVAFVRCYGAA